MAMTIEEMIDKVQMELTVSCQLPKDVPDNEIRRLIDEAVDYFHREYRYAVVKDYVYAPEEMMTPSPTGNATLTIEMPCEVVNILKVFPTNRNDLFQLGVYAPDLRIGLGVTSQPYLTSYITSIGELTVTRVTVQSFGEVLKRLERSTVKWSWSPFEHQLVLLSNLPGFSRDIVVEVYRKTAPENLFEDPIFRQYLYAIAKRQLGMILARYDFNLPGNFKYNYDVILRYADEEYQRILDKLKAMSKTSFIIMKS